MFIIEDTEKISSEVNFSTPACHDFLPSGGDRIGTRHGMPPLHSGEVEFADKVRYTTPASIEAEICDPTEEQILQEAKEIEMAPIMEVQAAMIREEFLNIPELHYENWKELSVEQRVEAMNQMEQKVARIAMREPVPVYCEDLKNGIMGLNTGDKLIIDEQQMSDSSYESYLQALDTLFHEGRHSYQKYNLLVKRVEQSDELVGSWIANYQLSYDNGNRLIFKEYGMLRYYTQPLEVDARLYAETVMRELEL